jgi:hypothetical protein
MTITATSVLLPFSRNDYWHGRALKQCLGGKSAWSRIALPRKRTHIRRSKMPEYVIEREMPGVGQLGPADLKTASQTSCTVLRELGPVIQWVHSYVTDDKLYCIYRAPSEELIREHAQRGGFPANKISPVRATINPTTAE